ncbi:techylectin-5A [Caerostris extrusa]|uniref:Techylectin-5A n=1 Tax=Caerostris extrusa TaxID=172846 RepID=A0AAV4VU84_CAEEX|nr:techylectin-5A [Caerostris extrusa]
MFSSSEISQIIWRYFKYFIAICFLCFIIVMAWKIKSMGSETEISHEAVILLESVERIGTGKNHFSASRTSKSLDFSNLSADSRPRDCSEISQRGKKLSGVYTIWPRSNITQNKPLQVYCDMNIDGEGWTVIQRRGNYPNPQRFDLAWDHYKTGFGDITKDFWLGNENIYALSNQGPCEIRFDLEDAKRSRRYSGNAGNSMRFHDGKQFATLDNDHLQLAEGLRGAWWMFEWPFSHLNGLYIPGVHDKRSIHWYEWRKNEGLASVEIKIRLK